MAFLPIAQINTPAGFIDLGRGDPQLQLLPLGLLRNAAHNSLSQPEHAILQYGAVQGNGYFRAALASFLSAQYGFPVSHESLFITSGISAALDLTCLLFTQPGDVVFVEEPSYFFALRIFADHGLRVVPLRTDEAGLDIADLKRALGESQPKFLYTIPAFQNPSGHTLSQERRQQLLALAEQHDFLILADEAYQFLGYTQSPPPSFAAHIASGRVISLGSFSKIFAPGLRLGWLQAHPGIIQRFTTSGLLDSGGGMNPFASAVMRDVIERGGLNENISKLLGIYSQRIKAMDMSLRRHLPEAEFITPHGGFFFWVRIPGVDTTELRPRAQALQADLRPGPLFSSRNGFREYFRISVSFYNEDEIDQGLKRLKEALTTLTV